MKRVLLAALLGCTRTESATPDAGPPNIVLEAMAAEPTPSATADAEAKTLLGTWERTSEPYRGMRIAFELRRAVVTLPPPVTEERVAAGAGTKAQLECQEKLWKPGETYIERGPTMGSSSSGESTRIVLRDWGLTNGVCRHADSMADARILLSGDKITISVVRGKAVIAQTWSRVLP